MAASGKRSWKLQEFVAHGGKVNCLALGRASGRVMVTGGEDKKVNMWAVGKPNCIMSLSGHTSPVESVRFGHAEEIVVAGSLSGALKLWDLELAKIVRTLTGHKASVKSLDLHPYGEFVASGSTDTNIKLWDIRRKGCIFTYKGHTNGVNTIRFSPDGRWIASASEDSTVKIWDLTAGKLLTDLRQHSASVTCLEFHPNEFLMATGSLDGTAKFWDLEAFHMVDSVEADAGGIRCICFHPDGQCLYAGNSDCCTVLGWEPGTKFDSVPVSWGNIESITVGQNQLIGASTNQSNVSTYVVDLSKTKPIGGSAPNQPSQTPLSSSGRKSFAERPPTQSTKQAKPKEEPLEHAQPEEDPAEDDTSTADIQNEADYREIFQPKNRDSNKKVEPFSPPDEGVHATKPSSANPGATKVIPASRHEPAGLNMDDFLPKQAQNAAGGVAKKPNVSEIDALNLIGRGHDSMMAVMSSRQRNLQIVRALWTGGNIKTAVDSAIGMNDQAVVVDVLNILCAKSNLWSLDMCALLLPQLKDLLGSKYENYVQTTCMSLRTILKNFGPVIKSNVTAAPAGGGVDISREERYQKCNTCYGYLMAIRAVIDKKASTSGKMSSTFREIQLLLGTLD
ncbi:unnamed protein product [Owenia fusiformis]|uniref:Katanin p80 WD40 repeat-containing subunit B1 n=1 Tax=Owenia fusiformis TaxID=6347 RepID=A0A8J1UQW0_OWEFU|nr:unnamed protein product [Owenia fusiformis]